ncbi:MAG: hypothetical protein ACSI46_14385 [Gloeotrichia echinulata DVL01]|jgi:hypothetical protein
MQNRDVESQSDTNQRENTIGAVPDIPNIPPIFRIQKRSHELKSLFKSSVWYTTGTYNGIEELRQLLLKEVDSSNQTDRKRIYHWHLSSLIDDWNKIVNLKSEIEDETARRYKKTSEFLKKTAAVMGVVGQNANSLIQQILVLAIYWKTPTGPDLGNIRIIPIQGVGETATPQETTTTGSLMQNSTMLAITDGSDTAATSPSTTPTMSYVGNVGSTGWILNQTPYNHPSWLQTMNMVGYGTMAVIIGLNLTPTFLNWFADWINSDHDTKINEKLSLLHDSLTQIAAVLEEIDLLSSQDIINGTYEIPVGTPQKPPQLKVTVVNEQTKASSAGKTRSKRK